MKTKRKKRWLIFLVLIVVLTFFIFRTQQTANVRTESLKRIQPVIGNIRVSISMTGIVQPQKRIEITPPISGRAEQILVKEGATVKKGQIVAWLSSTERAALLDAALAQGAASLKYWQNAYRPIPLIAPISGEVIVRAVEPGQSVNSSTPLLILADRLMVKAQVDETDIGKIKTGQLAEISLDAYPRIIVRARVAHIAYEAKTVSNVTIYEVDVIPDHVPRVFRSGMSASVEIIEKAKNNALLIPIEALQWRGKKAFANLLQADKTIRKYVETGLVNDNHVEIISGLTTEDIIVENATKVSRKKRQSSGANPFMPGRMRRRR